MRLELMFSRSVATILRIFQIIIVIYGVCAISSCGTTPPPDPNSPCSQQNAPGFLENFAIAGGVDIANEPDALPRGSRRVSFDKNLCGSAYHVATIWLHVTNSIGATGDLIVLEQPVENIHATFIADVAIDKPGGTYFARVEAEGTGLNRIFSGWKKIKISGGAILFVWSGKNQRVNPQEELSRDKLNPVAYGYNIAVQYLNLNNVPQNGRTVTFSSTDGGVVFAPSSTQTQRTSHPDLIDDVAIDGYATTRIWYNGTLISGERREVSIRAASFDGSAPIYADITLAIQLDRETSTLSGDNRHQRDGGSEIPGDTFPDPDNDKKKVYVEVDYVRGFAPLIGTIQQSDDVGGIMSLVSSIWDAHGVEIEYADQRVDRSAVPQNATRAEAQALLQTTRDNDKKRYLHVFIGRNGDQSLTEGNPVLGVTIQSKGWGVGGDGFSNLDCTNLASGDPARHLGRSNSSDYYLSRNGIFMLSDVINNYYFSGGPPPNERGWDGDWKKVYAVAIAHEIGHALGIKPHDNTDYNIMKSPLDYSGLYTQWIRLFPVSYALINTRNKVGVETVDVTH